MSRINIELPFRILSKKNSKNIVVAGNGRRYVVSNESYKDFEKMAVEYILYTILPRIKTLPKPPYKVGYDIYFKGKYEADLDNLIASINDILERAGIVDNDKHITEYLTPTRFTNCYEKFTALVTVEGSDGGAKNIDRTAQSGKR